MGKTRESQLQQTFKQVQHDETSMPLSRPALKDLSPLIHEIEYYNHRLDPPREEIKLFIKKIRDLQRYDEWDLFWSYFISGCEKKHDVDSCFADNKRAFLLKDAHYRLSKILKFLKKEFHKQCGDTIKDRVTHGVVETVVVATSSGRGGGISGIHPPLIKAPVREGEGVEVGIGRVNLKGKEEDGVLYVLNRSNNVSPNGRIKRVITPGCWQKGQLLGGGSFGSVYEGMSDDGFFFAVKEVSLHDQEDKGKQSVYQLEQEIALLSRFEHENIVQYYGTEKDESNLYIFIELVTKGSLRSLYQRYTLGDSQVSAYTRQILHGLKYLHDQNVVHRDIKCANILVHANESVKLADFGLAKATKLNDVKSCKGTAFWMAPEVVNAKKEGYGLPADVWSLGCTVLEMLTGQIPYPSLEGVQAIFRIGKGERPPIPDNLSGDAKDFIMQCLQVKPGDRPTAAQLLNHPFLQSPVSQSSSTYIHGRRG